uniref:Sulfotransferase domain-containing protein n=1 Tax=Phaeomonas parva TaxID=124430 RepID=A0A7S1UE25_9STRA|mmetsp:Transcript_43533/g.136552  ORF Transcript_43533/g.136552 Transcript_43533/m.136552 type:complete len:331 (+) Transcript_43533:752-1744(+)
MGSSKALAAFALAALSGSVSAASDEVESRGLRGRELVDKAKHHDPPIYFLHIHKSGGTMFCTLAQENGLRTNEDDNCNGFLDVYNADAVVHGRQFIGDNGLERGEPCCGDTAEKQRRVAANMDFDIVMNEGDLASEADWDAFSYVTILRDPVDRYISHFVHNKYKRPKFWEGTDFAGWLDRQEDNFAVRRICGKPCRVPKGQITAEHFEMAKARLDKFKVVMVLENISEGLAIVHKLFGWENAQNHVVSWIKSTQEAKTKAMLKTTDAGHVPDGMVFWDRALHAYAAHLQSHQYTMLYAAGVDSAFTEEHKSCVNTCCFEKCSRAPHWTL